MLAAVGAAFFALVVLRSQAPAPDVMRRHTLLLGVAFLVAFVGADALIRSTAGTATRFERWLDVAAVASVVGVARGRGGSALGAGALGRVGGRRRAVRLPHAVRPRARRRPAAAAGAARRPAAPRRRRRLARRARVAAARVPGGAEPARTAAARRFSSFAIPMVLVLVAGGVSRALTQLDSLSQLWETSYGRTLLVKSGLLLVLVALGWLNRGRLAAGFARMRPIVIAELLVLLVVVGAVGVLTDLRPGSARPPRRRRRRRRAWRSRRPRRRAGAFVDAGQAGKIAVGFAYDDGKAIVTLTDGSGDGVTDTPVTIDGAAGESCGRGCFSRAVPGPGVAVDVGGTPLQFAVPQYLRPATAEVNRLRLDYNALKSLVIDETLSSGPGSLQVTRFRQEAPGNMAYRIDEDSNEKLVGTEGIVIGARRWDKLPGGDWIEGPQSPLDLPKAYWTDRRAQRVLHGAERDLVLRPDLPGVVPRALRPEDGACDDAADDLHRALHAPPLLGLRPAGLDLAAALAVALRLALDQLEEARRVLERGEARRARRAGGASGRAGGPRRSSRRRRRARRARTSGARVRDESRRSWPSMRRIVRCRSRRSATCSWT